MSEINCPYCGHKQYYRGEPMSESETTEIECEKCTKIFQIMCSISVDYFVYELPCKNGEEHVWEKIIGFPEEYFENKRRCKYCDEIKELPQ